MYFINDIFWKIHLHISLLFYHQATLVIGSKWRLIDDGKFCSCIHVILLLHKYDKYVKCFIMEELEKYYKDQGSTVHILQDMLSEEFERNWYDMCTTNIKS